MALGRFCSVVVLASVLLGASVTSGFSAKDAGQTTSGLPLPRYVSLKSDHVNVRAGPTKDNDVAWVYTRSAPVLEFSGDFDRQAGTGVNPCHVIVLGRTGPDIHMIGFEADITRQRQTTGGLPCILCRKP